MPVLATPWWSRSRARIRARSRKLGSGRAFQGLGQWRVRGDYVSTVIFAEKGLLPSESEIGGWCIGEAIYRGEIQAIPRLGSQHCAKAVDCTDSNRASASHLPWWQRPHLKIKTSSIAMDGIPWFFLGVRLSWGSPRQKENQHAQEFCKKCPQ